MSALDEKRAMLMAAAEYGEILFAAYHAGSQPGAVRGIGVLTFVSETTIRAWCLMSGQIKCYRIDKLELVPENGPDQVRYRCEEPDPALAFFGKPVD